MSLWYGARCVMRTQFAGEQTVDGEARSLVLLEASRQSCRVFATQGMKSR
jgi:hypothetical protein